LLPGVPSGEPKGKAISPVAIKTVAMARADHAKTEGFSWPSIGTIARESGHSPATVKRALAWLEYLGFFKTVNSRQREGSSTKYLLREVIPVGNKEVLWGTMTVPVLAEKDTGAEERPAPASVSVCFISASLLRP
jgi:hypothetical protein